MSDTGQYRLPTNVKPTHYDITIKTDLKDLSFQGFVKVSLDVNTATSTIVLNTSELKLGNAFVYSDALKDEQLITTSVFDKAQERTTFQLVDKIPAGSKAEIRIEFAGELTGSMMGYYKASWKHEGKTKHYSLTQFEPTSARRAFPCWDEPLLKATFAITMISRADTTNLSNMAVIAEENIQPGLNTPAELAEILASTVNEGWKITKFGTTPPMSSYLVAFANGSWEFLEASVVMPLSGKTVPLRIYTTSDVIHQAQFALDVKAAVLPLYEKIFDVEYPLPKLDTLVASDFDSGAMENWGLIIGRTSAFLLDPQRANINAKRQIASGQSHEVAHMWFGNITTMEWWNNLYLKEGFATLMGEVIIPGTLMLFQNILSLLELFSRIFPDWRVNSAFIGGRLDRALSLDAKLSSHPIEVECPNANHINQIFDSLSYSKAASVLRMLSFYVGEEKFLKGVSLYLKKKLYSNGTTHDLWEGISTATGLNVTDLMENWINKIGFPVLTVTEDTNGITVRQDRFLETGPAESKDNETVWNVPLVILSVKDGKPVVDRGALLKERQAYFPLDTSKPFKLNAGTNGVYRVLYTPERLAQIAGEAMKKGTAFSLEDRMGLIYDTMALSQAGLSKLSSVLTLVELWKDEKDYLVWQSIGEILGQLKSIWWEYPGITAKLDAFRRSLFVPLVEKLGYEYSKDEPLYTSLLRTLAIRDASAAGDDGVVKELRSRFNKYRETGDDSTIPANLERVIFITAVGNGDREEYNAMIKILDKPKTPSQKIAAILAMGATQDEALLKETLTFMSTQARDQDVFYFFRSLTSNHKPRRLLTKYLLDEYDTVYKRFESGFTLSHLVSTAIDFYSSKADYEMLTAYFKDKDTSKYNQSLAQGLESIRARMAFIERSTEDLEAWLTKK